MFTYYSGIKVTENDFQEVVSKVVQNALILDEIASYLSFSDLKQFRLVSRQWNQESLPIFSKRVRTIDLIPESGRMTGIFARRLKVEKNFDGWAVNHFMEHRFTTNMLLEEAVNYGTILCKLIKDSNVGFPCSEFELTTTLLQSGLSKRLFYNLMEAVSNFATKLRLDVEHEKSVSMEMGTLQFPCLQELKLWQGELDRDEHDKTLKCFQHLIQNAPSLDTVSLYIWDGSLAGDFLTAISSSAIRGQLRSLDFQTDVRDEHLSKLKEMNLRLQKFGIGFTGSSIVDPENVISFLESQSANLKELRLAKWKYELPEPEFPFRFPCLRKLHILNLEGDPEFLSRLPEFSLSRDLPALKRLGLRHNFTDGYRVYSVPCNFSSFLNATVEPLTTVETLVIHMTIDKLSETEVDRIFPRLKRLECHGLDEEEEEEDDDDEEEEEEEPLWVDELTHLEELSLHVEGTNYIDQTMNSSSRLITGYLDSELKEMEIGWRRAWIAGEDVQIKVSKHPNEFLQKLKVLRIHGGKFTDVHCLLGLLRLRSLQCLDLRNSPDSRVSQRVLDQMREKFAVLIKDNCVNLNPEMFFTVKQSN